MNSDGDLGTTLSDETLLAQGVGWVSSLTSVSLILFDFARMSDHGFGSSVA